MISAIFALSVATSQCVTFPVVKPTHVVAKDVDVDARVAQMNSDAMRLYKAAGILPCPVTAQKTETQARK